jgi:hypothetical protein
MQFMTTLDENRVIDITSVALGGKLAAHRKFKESHSLEHLNLSDIQKGSRERAQRTTIATRPNALRGTSLQEVVVEIDARDVNLHKTSKTSVEFSRNWTSNSQPASSFLQNESDTSREHKISRDEIGIQRSGSSVQCDGGDLKLAKRREERAAARATQRSLQSAGVAAGSSREAADPHFRKSQTEVDIQGLGPPPPFDEEDFKMAKRREERAAARAAQKQSSLSATSAHGIDWFA